MLASVGETQLTRLQVAQNRAMRVILQCDRYTGVERMLQALQFMSVRQRLYYNVCIFVFKMIKGMLPEQLNNKLVLVGNTIERQMRQTNNIVIQFRRTKSAQKSLFYEGIQMYNAMPSELKQCDRLTTFKRMLKEYIIPKVDWYVRHPMYNKIVEKANKYHSFIHSTRKRKIFFCLRLSIRIPPDFYGSNRCTQKPLFSLPADIINLVNIQKCIFRVLKFTIYL